MLERERAGQTQVRLWLPTTIGWLTLVLSLVIGAIAFACGFVLAAINWYRLGQRRKATLHFVLGPILAVALSVVASLYRFDAAHLVAYLIIAFFVVAYLHKATERSISRLQPSYTVQPGKLSAAVGVAVLVGLVMLPVLIGVNYGVAILRTPKVRSTATLVPGGDPAVTGTIHPWTEGDGPIEGRGIVLCELITATRFDPYDCTLTALTATTDAEGRFEIERVPEGQYLLFYESGLADFDAAVARWAGKAFRLGDYWWLRRQGFFQGNPDGSFTICWPSGEGANDFYRDYFELTLMAGGSPFYVAHDIEVAVSAKYERELLSELPSGVFVPTSVEIVEGFTSQVAFDVLNHSDIMN